MRARSFRAEMTTSFDQLIAPLPLVQQLSTVMDLPVICWCSLFTQSACSLTTALSTICLKTSSVLLMFGKDDLISFLFQRSFKVVPYFEKWEQRGSELKMEELVTPENSTLVKHGVSEKQGVDWDNQDRLSHLKDRIQDKGDLKHEVALLLNTSSTYTIWFVCIFQMKELDAGEGGDCK